MWREAKVSMVLADVSVMASSCQGPPLSPDGSRVAIAARSGCLRGSGELPLRRHLRVIEPDGLSHAASPAAFTLPNRAGSARFARPPPTRQLVRGRAGRGRLGLGCLRTLGRQLE